MTQATTLSPSDIFTNSTARAAELTDEFWFDAYHRWQDAVQNSPESFFRALDDPHTFRMPFPNGHADVLVRTQPEGREYYSIRMTAFPADDRNPPTQVERWHQDTETRPTLGEAVILDANLRW